jgi:hypothetical protein
MMDQLWMWIVEIVWRAKAGLDVLVHPLNTVHPALAIVALAGGTFLGTSALRKRFVTRRFRRLEAEFTAWRAVREEALERFDDPSRGRQMARNIDQAELNKIYYDYFFEGFLNNLMNTYLPTLFMAAYVNEAFKPAALQGMIGRDAFWTLAGGGRVGGLPLFVLCLLLFWIGWPLLKRRASARADAGRNLADDSGALS